MLYGLVKLLLLYKGAFERMLFGRIYSWSASPELNGGAILVAS